MRRKEREFALKILYAHEFNDESLETHKKSLNDKELKYETEFSVNIIDFYKKHFKVADETIIEHIKNWEYNRVAIIDKIILRIAYLELMYFPDIPPEATLNEAIELAKKYSTPKSGFFVNGVIDSIIKDQRNELKEIKKGRGRISKIVSSN
ncbi:MAG: transcription antitermination factor NusB [Calditrichia bacterium]|nr:transcription antitermination factor NusB [Calditrichia bacterium]